MCNITVIAAFLTGIIAIIWKKERALLIYLYMALLVVVFVIGEILAAR